MGNALTVAAQTEKFFSAYMRGNRMDCPACTEPMIVMELNEIEIDHCIACQGIWFDAGELELLLEGANADVVLTSLKPDKANKEKKEGVQYA